MTVWVLVLFMAVPAPTGTVTAGPAAITGLASEADCEALKASIPRVRQGLSVCRPYQQPAAPATNYLKAE